MRERSAHRVVPAKPVTVALGHPKKPLAYGVVANISECGGCVLTAGKFDVGEEVVLTLSFAREAQPIETPGRIIWINQGPSGTLQYGLKFDTTFDTHIRLKQLIGNFADEPSDG
jgi:Tfp pilus assembly protein PilZ